MKRIIALLLALLMGLSLAACASKESNAEPKQTGSAQAPAQSEGKANAGTKNDGFTALEVDKAQRICDMEITAMRMGKEEYAVDEPITVTVSWTGNYADDTWIGIIPAETPHGSEETNDEFDVDYRYFPDAQADGTFVFDSITLEPGDYTMRINESDAGGAELAWCAFKVK